MFCKIFKMVKQWCLMRQIMIRPNADLSIKFLNSIVREFFGTPVVTELPSSYRIALEEKAVQNVS